MIDIQVTPAENARADSVNDQPTSHDALLTPRQAAAFLSVPVQTLAIWRCNGRVALRFVKVGRHVRYRRSDLMAFVQTNLREAA